MTKTAQIRERGEWVSKQTQKARAFNKSATQFLSGGYEPAYKRKLFEFKKMTARVCKPTTQTVAVRPDGG